MDSKVTETCLHNIYFIRFTFSFTTKFKFNRRQQITRTIHWIDVFFFFCSYSMFYVAREMWKFHFFFVWEFEGGDYYRCGIGSLKCSFVSACCWIQKWNCRLFVQSSMTVWLTEVLFVAFFFWCCTEIEICRNLVRHINVQHTYYEIHRNWDCFEFVLLSV